MSRRLGLVALWAVFAAAAVGVGFAAAGLVGDPFTDPRDTAVSLSEPGSGAGAGAGSGAGAPATPSPSGSSATGTPSRSPTPPSRTSGSAQPDTPVLRSITTRGGIVSGSCSRGSVTVSAAPSIGWAIDDVDAGPAPDARVRFERAGSGDDRVEVRAACRAGVPRFTVDDRTGDDHSGPGGGDSGSGGGSGSGTSGGPGPG